MSQYQLIVTDCFFEKTKVGGDVDTKDSAAAGMEILFFAKIWQQPDYDSVCTHSDCKSGKFA